MKLLAWGANSYGQLGLGYKCEQILEPTEVSLPSELNVENIRQIKGGAGHTIILDNRGALYACGWNTKGQLGLTEECYQFCKISSLKDHISKVSCGWDSTAAVTKTGRIFMWGSNAFGQLGIPKDIKFTSVPYPLSITNVKKVSCGLRHLALVTTDGKVYVCGNGSKGQLGLAASTLKFYDNQLVLVADLNNISSISCGQNHTVALNNTGIVYVWGDNKHGQLGFDPNDITQLTTPTKLPIDIIPKKIFTGWTHTAILTQDGGVLNFGRNKYGELGEYRERTWIPSKLEVDKVKFMSVGSEHNLIINENDDLLSWGWNEHGNCGTGDVDDVLKPKNILLGQNIVYIATGCGQSFCIVK